MYIDFIFFECSFDFNPTLKLHSQTPTYIHILLIQEYILFLILVCSLCWVLKINYRYIFILFYNFFFKKKSKCIYTMHHEH